MTWVNLLERPPQWMASVITEDSLQAAGIAMAGVCCSAEPGTEQRRCFIHVRGPPHGTNQVKGSEGCIIGPCNKLSDDATSSHAHNKRCRADEGCLASYSSLVCSCRSNTRHMLPIPMLIASYVRRCIQYYSSVGDDCGGAVKVEVGRRRHHRLILQGTRITFSLSSSIIFLLLLFRPLVCPPTTALLPLHNRVVIHPGPIAPPFICPRSNHILFVAFHSSD